MDNRGYVTNAYKAVTFILEAEEGKYIGTLNTNGCITLENQKTFEKYEYNSIGRFLDGDVYTRYLQKNRAGLSTIKCLDSDVNNLKYLSDVIIKNPTLTVSEDIKDTKTKSITTTFDFNNREASTLIPEEHYEKAANSMATQVTSQLKQLLKSTEFNVNVVTLPEANESTDDASNNLGLKIESKPYTVDDFRRDIVLPNGYTFERLKKTLEIKHALLFAAPPGTGKTTAATSLVNALIGETNSARCMLLSFNQSTDYSDVVCGLRQNKKGIWESKDGTLKYMCEKAFNDPENNYYVILDEINRGNTMGILGEYITAMSQLGKPVTINNGDIIVMPKNLYIVATMNTVDASVAEIDAALRDRFAIVKMQAQSFTAEDIKGSDIDDNFKAAINLTIKAINNINEQLATDPFKGVDNTIGMRQLYSDCTDIDGLVYSVIEDCIRPQVMCMTASLGQEAKDEIEEIFENLKTKILNMK